MPMLVTKSALAFACGAGLLLSAAVDRAEAQFVRDHRNQATDTRPGGVSVGTRGGRLPKSYFQGTPAPRRCNGRVWGGVCRDHRR
jgi:hypothetical protein